MPSASVSVSLAAAIGIRPDLLTILPLMPPVVDWAMAAAQTSIVSINESIFFIIVKYYRLILIIRLRQCRHPAYFPTTM